ncbi:MAG TPA: protealysin inhibitor emfourin [Candidatus Binatia bacterium]|jgi:hypothetical protein
MKKIQVERLGGVAGFGTRAGHLRSRGEIHEASLCDADRAAVDALFESAGQAAPARSGARGIDELRYRLTREGPRGDESVEASESAVPQVLRESVKDEIV